MRHAKLEVQKWRKVNLDVELRYVIDLIEFYFISIQSLDFTILLRLI